jgi:WD40 repeat protein
MITGYEQSHIRIWEFYGDDECFVRDCLTGHKDSVLSVAVNLDIKKVISGSKDGTVRVWGLETGRRLDLHEMNTNRSAVKSVAISPDGSSFAACSENNQILKYEFGKNGSIKYTVTIDEKYSHAESICYSPDSKRLLVSMADGTARLYNSGDLSEIARFL